MASVDLIFKCYYRPLCLYALHYLRDIDAAEDIVQDCFVSLIEHIGQGHSPQQARPYLYSAVRNRCIDQLRKANHIDTNLEPQDLEGAISDEEAAERSLHEAELWTAIDRLPLRQRQVLLMAKRDNMKYRDIASTLGISEKTVENHMTQALKALRGKTSDFFYLLALTA